MDSLIISNTTNTRPTAVNEIRLDLSSFMKMTDMKVALGYLGLYYSWRNISAANNNNLLQYIWTDGTSHDCLISDGFYSIDQLSGFLQFIMFKNHHYMLDANGSPVYFIDFTANAIYYATTFDCLVVNVPAGGSNPFGLATGQAPQLVIPNNNIQYNLGANPGSYPATAGTTVSYSFNSQNIPQISSITTVNVSCNLVNSNFNQYSNVIKQFAPQGGYGSYIVVEPYAPFYYDVTDGSYTHISLYLYDQLYQPIPILDRNITATLKFVSSQK